MLSEASQEWVLGALPTRPHASLRKGVGPADRQDPGFEDSNFRAEWEPLSPPARRRWAPEQKRLS